MSVQLPPHSLEAEAAVIAACMSSKEARRKSMLKVTHEHFYSGLNRIVFESIEYLHNTGSAIDIATIANRIRSAGHVIPVSTLTDMLDAGVQFSAVKDHAEIVRDLFNRRALIAAAQRIAAEGYVGKDTTEECITGALAAIGAIAKGAIAEGNGPVSASDICAEVWESINKGEAPSIKTGFDDFDLMSGGLFPSDLMVFAARPGGGKSAAALSLALSVAKQGHGVMFFSLEMARRQLLERAVCHEASFDMSRLRVGIGSDQRAMNLISTTLNEISKLPLFIDDSAGLTAEQIALRVESCAADMASRGQTLKLVIVDYIQLIRGSDKKVQSRAIELDIIAQGLKELSKRTSVTLIALAQFNRLADSGDAPSLSWLKESSGIEQAADAVVFIMKGDAAYHDETCVPMRWLFAKQRNGRSQAAARVWFEPAFTRFTNRDGTP